MSGIDLFNFKHITKAAEATEEHPLHAIIKVYFQEHSFDKPNEAIAIDIENNEIYVQPIIGIRGLRAGGGIIQIDHAVDVLNVLKENVVFEWDTLYAGDDADSNEDGYRWDLILQFKDGTVKRHKGYGEDVKPKRFNEFVKELANFVEGRLQQ